MDDQRVRRTWRTRSLGDAAEAVERSAALALATGCAVLVVAIMVFGRVPIALALFLPPAVWSFCAIVPWQHKGDPLRWNVFGFLAVATALLAVFAAPLPLMIGPANVLALSALVVAVRVRSPFLALAGLVITAVTSVFDTSSIVLERSPLPYLGLLLALIGLWVLLPYVRGSKSQHNSPPATQDLAQG